MYRRTIVVLIFAAAVAALLMTFPGPFFDDFSNTRPNFSPTFSEAMPMDADDARTIELRIEAKSAMNAIVGKHSQMDNDEENESETRALLKR
jgi:hypothetical protein